MCHGAAKKEEKIWSFRLIIRYIAHSPLCLEDIPESGISAAAVQSQVMPVYYAE